MLDFDTGSSDLWGEYPWDTVLIISLHQKGAHVESYRNYSSFLWSDSFANYETTHDYS
jgi:hypothetical protein